MRCLRIMAYSSQNMGILFFLATVFGFATTFVDAATVFRTTVDSVSSGSESVEYDAANSLLFFHDWINGIVYSTDYDIHDILAGNFNVSTDNPFDNGDYGMALPAGMYSDGTYLYVNSMSLGTIVIYDISSLEAVDEIEIYHNSTEGIIANLNGMCNDPTDSDIIYVTDPGFNVSTFSTFTSHSALYKVNISSKEYTKLIDFGAVRSSSNHGGNQTVGYPNGCVVSSDGSTLYAMEDFPDSSLGGLIVYDIDDDSWSSISSGIDHWGNGVVLTGDDSTLYYSQWSNNNSSSNGYLYKIEVDDIDIQDKSTTIELIANGLINPSDLAIDDDNDIIIVPALTFSSPGYIYFIDIGDSDSDDGVSTRKKEGNAIVVAFGLFMLLLRELDG